MNRRNLTLLTAIAAAAAFAPTAQAAAILAIDSVTSTTTGTVGDPQTIIIDSITVGSTTYDTDDLVTGTSKEGATSIGDQDDFDMNTYYSRPPAGLGWTTSFGATNLSGAVFFLFEGGGNDALSVRPIFGAGGTGTYVALTTGSGAPWGDTGVTITEGARTGNNAFGVTFSYFDLKDGSGNALTTQVITGLEFLGPNSADVSSISASVIPEPSAALLLGVAGMTLLVRRRRA